MDSLDKKIEQTLSALDGIQRAEVPDDLFEKTLKRIAESHPVKVVKMVPMRTVWLAAASFALMVSLNLAFWVSGNTAVAPKNSPQTCTKAACSIAELYINNVN
jgi:hypothetical protein